MDIKEFYPLVQRIALMIRRPLPANILLDDLIQDGMIGLISAFREHDPATCVPFPAFAASKIRWAIMDGLRSGDWAERGVRQRANKVGRVISELEAGLCRRPSLFEIASALGVRVNDVAVILSEAHGQEFVSLYDAEVPVDIPDAGLEPSVIVERRQAHSRAVACLKSLMSMERRAFILCVMCEMSLAEASAELGVGRSRVSQLKKAAAEKLAECAERSSGSMAH